MIYQTKSHPGGLSTSLAQQPQEEEQQRPVRGTYDDDEDDDEEQEEEDSDDELLRELEGDGESGGFMEVRMAEMMRKAEEAAELRHLGVGLHTGGWVWPVVFGFACLIVCVS